MQEGVELEERDFFKDRFTEGELRALLGEHPASEFFSWKSPSFRKLGLDRGSLADDRLISMMLDEPRLIRRPLVKIDGKLIDGRDRSALSDVLLV